MQARRRGKVDPRQGGGAASIPSHTERFPRGAERRGRDQTPCRAAPRGIARGTEGGRRTRRSSPTKSLSWWECYDTTRVGAETASSASASASASDAPRSRDYAQSVGALAGD